MARIEDPRGPLREASVPEEALRSILRLLVVEALVGAGRARRLTTFQLGPPAPGGRRLALGWETHSPHPGRSAERREVEGRIDL